MDNGRNNDRTKIRILPLWLLLGACFVSFLLLTPRLVVANEPKPDSCGKNETKTGQGCAKNPRLVHRVEPEYPKEARKQHVTGSVTLSARVTVEGTVDEIQVRNAQATDVSFIPSLQDAAVAALGKWRYRPATIKGKPVAFYFEITINFMM